jgi:hypothetical protein
MTKAHEAIFGIEIDYDLSRTGREQAPPDLSAGAFRETMRTGVSAWASGAAIERHAGSPSRRLDGRRSAAP